MENDFISTYELCGFVEEGYEDELWGLIPGYENYYISTKGRVWNSTYRRFINPGLDTHGYLYVNLSLNGERKIARIHRIEAIVFIPNPDNLPVARHLNDIKTDNRVENLAWGTTRDNYKDSISNGRRDNGPKPIIAINNDTGIGYYYESCAKASRDLGYNPTSFNNALIQGYNIGGYRIIDAKEEYLYDGIQNGDPVKHLFPTRKMPHRPKLSTKVLCTRCEDGEELIFDNIIEVVKFFDSPYATIMSAISHKCIHKGYRIEYVY